MSVVVLSLGIALFYGFNKYPCTVGKSMLLRVDIGY